MPGGHYVATVGINEGRDLMASEQSGAMRKHVHVLFHSGTFTGLSDGQLLERFATRRDLEDAEAAFAALVERHAPMVLRVCRHMLGNAHDAQDASQATFLVLARRAHAIRRRDSVGSWLHGVALRVAAKAKVAASRRRVRERRGGEMAERHDVEQGPDPLAMEPPWPELHEELGRLPEKYRAPIVLCHLEGLTQEQAAGQLRWPVGTLQSRLARGRERLRARLVRRGLGMSAVLLTVGPASGAAEAVPASWAEATVRASVRIAAGGVAPTEMVSATVATLIEGVLKAMMLTKLKAAASLALAIGALVAIAGDRLRPMLAVGAEGVREARAAKDVPLRKDYDGPFPDVVTFRELALRVIDEATGVPIPDAQVLVFECVDLKSPEFKTDADGRLRVQFPVINDPSVALEIRKEGYVPQRYGFGFDFEKGSPIPASLSVGLRSGTAIGGSVVDESGKPIAGVQVVMTVSGYSEPRRPKIASGHEMLYEVPARTDAEGRWRCNSIPPDAAEVSLQLIHPDFVSGNSSSLGGPGLRLPPLGALRKMADRQVMVKGERISGRVLDADGEPIAGARVVDSSAGSTFLPYIRQAVSDKDGDFHFHIDPKERVPLTAQAKGHAPPEATILARAATGPIEFRLGRGKTIHGRVVDTRGKPIPGVMVYVSSINRKYKDVFLRMWTDSDGRFRWQHAPDDDVPLEFSKGGYQWLQGHPVAPSSRGATVVLKRASIIVVTARDRATGEKVDRYTCYPGAEDAKTGALLWDRGEARTVNDGTCRLQLIDEGQTRRIRVEAVGYEPFVSRALKDEGDELELDVPLSKIAGPGLAGLVRSPDGKALAGGEVVAGGVLIRDGKVVDAEHPIKARTDAEGRFTVPKLEKPFPLAVVADGGFAEVTQEQFAASPEITIRPWGRIEGEIRVGTKPAAGLEVELIRDLIRNQGEPTIKIEGKTTTDTAGRFRFEKVIPSPDVRIFHDLFAGRDTRGRSYGTLVDVKPGETNHVTLGGTGRPVIGRILPTEAGEPFLGWIELERNRPSIPYPKEVLRAKDDSLTKWRANWWYSAEGRADRRGRIGRSLEVTGGDGTFRFEDIPAGEYRLRLTASSGSTGRRTVAPLAGLTHVFTIPEMEGGQNDEPFDLGPLSLKARESTKVGDLAPPFDVRTLDGKPLRLEDYRGKYVLLDFWATWCGPCIVELPHLKEVHEAYGKEDRLITISLSLDDEAEKPRDFVAKHGLGWIQGFLGDWSESPVAKAYHVASVPTILLIGPDGRVLAVGLRRERIRSAVATALGEPL